MNKKTTLNIGLENNCKYNGTSESVSEIVKSLSVIGSVDTYRVDVGEYDGKPEKTMIVVFDSINDSFAYLHGDNMLDVISFEVKLERLCNDLTQECISYSSEHINCDGLVYCTSMATDDTVDRYEFDPKYFIRY